MNGKKTYKYRLRLKRPAFPVVLAWIELALVGTQGFESPEVAWRKLSIAQERARIAFARRQGKIEDLKIAAGRLESVKNEQTEREVDFELFLEKNPVKELEAKDKILFWRALKIRREEEARLTAMAKPVEEERSRVRRIEGGVSRLEEEIEALEKEREDAESEVSVLEARWIGAVAREAVELMEKFEFDEAKSRLSKRLEADRMRAEFEFLLWLAGLGRFDPGVSSGVEFQPSLPADSSSPGIQALLPLSGYIRGALPALLGPENPALSALVRLLSLTANAEESPGALSFEGLVEMIGVVLSHYSDEKDSALAFAQVPARVTDVFFAITGHSAILSGEAERWIDYLRESGIVFLETHRFASGVLIHAYLALGWQVPPELLDLFRHGRSGEFIRYTLTVVEGTTFVPGEGEKGSAELFKVV